MERFWGGDHLRAGAWQLESSRKLLRHPLEAPLTNLTDPPRHFISVELRSSKFWDPSHAGCAGHPIPRSSKRVLRGRPAGTLLPLPRSTWRSSLLPPCPQPHPGSGVSYFFIICYGAGASEVAGAEALLGVCRVWELDAVDARAKYFRLLRHPLQVHPPKPRTLFATVVRRFPRRTLIPGR